MKQKSGITRHEEEICCLIKWNFPRKDQMAVFNNTTDALTKSKSRLKKRLQLDEKTDLDQFIRMYREKYLIPFPMIGIVLFRSSEI